VAAKAGFPVATEAVRESLPSPGFVKVSETSVELSEGLPISLSIVDEEDCVGNEGSSETSKVGVTKVSEIVGDTLEDESSGFEELVRSAL
jgi:hypothetical protein